MDWAEKLAVVWVVLILTTVFGAVAGYVVNIVDIIHTVNDPINGMFILRAIGVFVVPLGALLGWF